MIVGSLRSNNLEDKRLSITPESAKSYINLGLNVILEKNYGEHLNISDNEYIKNSVKIVNNRDEILQNSDLITLVSFNNQFDEKIIKNNCIVIGLIEKSISNNFDKKNIKFFSLTKLPRITRAQSMDVLSSQSNLGGYRAVIDSMFEFEKAMPMMMTAAGTIPAARVLVIGVGVAGLQAIATAKRMGAIVSATDVRAVAKEQVESLGAKFLFVDNDESLETAGGYAKEVSSEYKTKQSQMLEEALKKNDIIICTAQIPGKKAPKIVNNEMLKSVKSGSIIFDLAAEQGGNCEHTKAGEIVNHNGIKIIGAKNLMNKLPLTASNLYSKNIFSFVRNLYSKEKKTFNINLEDEIISKTIIK